MLTASIAAGDALWDEEAGLLWTHARHAHGIRPSAWYALGLMLRDGPGDRERSRRVVRRVLDRQMDEPASPWHGTFHRRGEDPPLAPGAKMWKDYDPNWRQFIGTVFALLLTEFPDRFSAAERERLLGAIERAIVGELKQGRLVPAYTNIALMHGFLWAFAGERLPREAWVRDAEAWTESIYARFKPHESFDEYNSPTYYGVDLYGLALLRRHGATPRLKELGATMEAALWRDIGRFYHADLLNMCGPFDRSYGMDMRRYAALTGAWIGLELPADKTPFPPLAGPMEHAADFLCVPTYVLLGAKIPDGTRAHLERFQGERQLTRPIADGRRTATAWLGRDIAIGGQATGMSRGVAGPSSQFYPATVHWRAPDGGVGWIALRECPPVDAVASRHRLAIAANGDCTFRISVAGAIAADVRREAWELPGLRVAIETDAKAFEVVEHDGAIEVSYRRATSIVLCTEN